MKWNVTRDTPGPYSGPKKIPGEPLKPWEPNALLSPGTFTGSKRESFLLTTKSSPRAFFLQTLGIWQPAAMVKKNKSPPSHWMFLLPTYAFTLFFFSAHLELHWLLAKNLRNLCEKVEYLIIGKIKSLTYLIFFFLRSGFCVFSTLFKCTIQCSAGQLLNTQL